MTTSTDLEAVRAEVRTLIGHEVEVMVDAVVALVAAAGLVAAPEVSE